MRIINLLCMLLILPALAFAESDLVKKPSAHSVKETMDRLEAVVKEKGMDVFSRIDHRANAESVGKTMPDSQLLIFGKPEAGTRIMMHDLAVGLDLPLRVLAYSDFDGKTWVVYHNPQGLRAMFGVEECKILGNMETALDNMTNQATK